MVGTLFITISQVVLNGCCSVLIAAATFYYIIQRIQPRRGTFSYAIHQSIESLLVRPRLVDRALERRATPHIERKVNDTFRA